MLLKSCVTWAPLQLPLISSTSRPFHWTSIRDSYQNSRHQSAAQSALRLASSIPRKPERRCVSRKRAESRLVSPPNVTIFLVPTLSKPQVTLLMLAFVWVADKMINSSPSNLTDEVQKGKPHTDTHSIANKYYESASQKVQYEKN